MGEDELTLFGETEKTVTTKELAEQLHTSKDVVLANAKKCLPNKKIEHGKPTYWSKAEITILIEQMKTSNPNQHTFTGAVKAVSTDLTPALKIRGQNQDYISVKELASELNVSDQTIRNSVKELFTDPSKLLWRVVNGGKSLFLSKEQATAIKLKLRTRNNLKDASVIKQIGNDLEFFALLKQRENEQRLLDEYRDRRIAELTAENERQKIQLEEQRPQVAGYKLTMDSDGTYSMAESAKLLKLPYGNVTLFKKLRDFGILDRNNVPLQEYVNRGYFTVITKPIVKGSVTENTLVTRVTARGADYIARKLGLVISKEVA